MLWRYGVHYIWFCIYTGLCHFGSTQGRCCGGNVDRVVESSSCRFAGSFGSSGDGAMHVRRNEEIMSFLARPNIPFFLCPPVSINHRLFSLPIAHVGISILSVATGEIAEILKRPDLYLMDFRPMIVIVMSGFCSL